MAYWRLTTLGKLAIAPDSSSSGGNHSAHSSTAPVEFTPELQPQSLLLLAVLASANAQGMDRDHLLLFFWPDSGVVRARNALRQTLFRLRRDLETQDAILGTTTLRLNPDVVRADVVEFDEALASGDLERAVAMYTAPFLTGVSLGATPELDTWVAEERGRLEKRFAAAVDALASGAEARGEHDQAIGWWRKLAAVDPTSTRAAFGLMSSLAATGDRDGALRYFRLHEVLLEEKLGVTPDETVVALVNRLGLLEPNARRVEPNTPPSTETRSPVLPPRRRRGILWTGSAAGLMLLGALFVRTRSYGSEVRDRVNDALRPASTENVVAVLPFTLRSVDAAGSARGNERLADDVAAMLAAHIDGVGGIRAVEPRAIRALDGGGTAASADLEKAASAAQRVNADRYMVGEVHAERGLVRIVAVVYRRTAGTSSQTEPPIRLLADGPIGEVFAVTEDLARQTLAALHNGTDESLTRSAALSTRSLTAIKAYLDGEQLFRQRAYARSVDAFQRAVDADSSFAFAWYRMAVAADWGARPDAFAAAAGWADRNGAAVRGREGTLIRAFAAWHRGDANTAERLYRTIVTQYADDVDAWYQLCETQFHLGPVYGRPVLDARHACERTLSLRPNDREARVHLMRLAAKAGNARAVEAHAKQLLDAATAGDSAAITAFRAFAIGDSDDEHSALGALRQSDDETVMHAAIKVGVYAEDLEGAARIARLLGEGVRGDGYRATGVLYEAFLHAARGRLTEASAHLASIERTFGIRSTGLRLGLGVLRFPPASPVTIAAMRDTLRRWDQREQTDAYGAIQRFRLLDARYRSFALGLAEAQLGDIASAEAAARDLEREQNRDSVTAGERALAHDLAQVVRAQVARRRGNQEEALALAGTETPPYPGLGALESIVTNRAYQRFLRAELLRELGRDEEALRWYGSIGGVAVPELLFLAPAALRQAEIYERRGDRAQAARHYTRFVRLWRNCDHELRPLVDDATSRLRRLTSRPVVTR